MQGEISSRVCMYIRGALPPSEAGREESQQWHNTKGVLFHRLKKGVYVYKGYPSSKRRRMKYIIHI